MNPRALGTEELLDLITRHQVIEAEALWQFLASKGGVGGLSADASEVVGDLVQEGLLSPYQGEQLLSGEVGKLIVGKYQLLDRLGGLDSSVYLAQRKPHGPKVALKLLTRDQNVPTTLVERFRREAEALARLDHPGIVGIKDSGEDEGRLFLVMEYLEGETLAELVQREGPLPPAMAVRIVHTALEALEHIYQGGLVHRNLEPGHLMIDQTGKVRIVDLGLARFLDEPGANLTLFGASSQLLGTVEYQSPEQLINSHDVDIRTDIYALGAILYFLLTGKAPFGQHALLRLAAGVITYPQPLAQLRPDLPTELIEVVERMMALDRQQRPGTPAEASAALEEWLHVVSPPPLKVHSRRTSTTVPVRKRPVEELLRADPPVREAGAGAGAGGSESGIPTWLLTGLLFGATMALALAARALWKGI